MSSLNAADTSPLFSDKIGRKVGACEKAKNLLTASLSPQYGLESNRYWFPGYGSCDNEKVRTTSMPDIFCAQISENWNVHITRYTAKDDTSPGERPLGVFHSSLQTTQGRKLVLTMVIQPGPVATLLISGENMRNIYMFDRAKSRELLQTLRGFSGLSYHPQLLKQRGEQNIHGKVQTSKQMSSLNAAGGSPLFSDKIGRKVVFSGKAKSLLTASLTPQHVLESNRNGFPGDGSCNNERVLATVNPDVFGAHISENCNVHLRDTAKDETSYGERPLSVFRSILQTTQGCKLVLTMVIQPGPFATLVISSKNTRNMYLFDRAKSWQILQTLHGFSGLSYNQQLLNQRSEENTHGKLEISKTILLAYKYVGGLLVASDGLSNIEVNGQLCPFRNNYKKITQLNEFCYLLISGSSEFSKDIITDLEKLNVIGGFTPVEMYRDAISNYCKEHGGEQKVYSKCILAGYQSIENDFNAWSIDVNGTIEVCENGELMAGSGAWATSFDNHIIGPKSKTVALNECLRMVYEAIDACTGEMLRYIFWNSGKWRNTHLDKVKI